MKLPALSFIPENEVDLDEELFPIPFKESIQVSSQSNLDEKAGINIIHINGQVMFRHIGFETLKGVELFLLEFDELPTGVHLNSNPPAR